MKSSAKSTVQLRKTIRLVKGLLFALRDLSFQEKCSLKILHKFVLVFVYLINPVKGSD